MFEWIEALTTLQKVFFTFAAIGSVLFVLRTIMMFIGFGDDADIGDTDSGDMDFDGSDGDVEHSGTDASFSVLSFQGLSAFFMMFGLVGLAMSKGSGYGFGLSMLTGTGAGILTIWIIKQLFRGFSNLQSSGTLNLKNAVGEEGTVYLTIQENEPGKVRVTVQGHLKVMEAISDDGTKIPTDSRVKVLRLSNGNVLVVEKI